MSRVQARCPSCGPQVLAPYRVKVHVSRVEGAGARWSFECIGCRAWVSRAGDHAGIRQLLAAGAVPDVVPKEVLEHPEPEVPPLADHDLAAFLDQLDSCEYPALAAT